MAQRAIQPTVGWDVYLTEMHIWRDWTKPGGPWRMTAWCGPHLITDHLIPAHKVSEEFNDQDQKAIMEEFASEHGVTLAMLESEDGGYCNGMWVAAGRPAHKPARTWLVACYQDGSTDIVPSGDRAAVSLRADCHFGDLEYETFYQAKEAAKAITSSHRWIRSR